MATTYSITWPAVVDQGTGPGVPAAFTLTLDSASVSSSAFSVTDGGFGGTFLPSASPSIPAGQLSATFTYKPSASTVDRSISITVTNFAALAQPTPASRTFTVTSFGYYRSIWVANMSAMVTLWAGHGPSAPLWNATQGLMYDPLKVSLDLRRITGNPAFDNVIAAALYQWRDLYSLKNGGAMADYNNNTRGLRDHWVLTGDEDSRAAAIMQSIETPYSSDSFALTSADQKGSRPYAFAIMSHLDAEDCGCAHRAMMDGVGGGAYANGNNLVNMNIGYILQWITPEASWPGCRWLQPFMAGITMRSLIAYWDRYRDENNGNFTNLGVPIPGAGVQTMGLDIPAVIRQMLDTLWTGSNRSIPFWFPNQHRPHTDYPAYPFADDTNAINQNGPPGTGAFGYVYPQSVLLPPGCWPANVGPSDPAPVAGLNAFIYPAFYFYSWYASTFLGDPALADTYRRRGDAVFAGTTTSSPNVFVFGSEKGFNECYFWATDGVGWRDRIVAPPAVATGLTLTPPAAASGAANAPGARYTVATDPPGSAPAAPVVVTPAVSGGGRTLPAVLRITPERTAQVFRPVPAAASAGSGVSVSVASTLTNPAPLTYAATTARPTATGYAVSVPTNLACGPHLISDPFVAALSPANATPAASADATGGLIVVAHSASVVATFNPAISWLTADRPTASWTLYANGTAARSLLFSNTGGFTNATQSVPFTPLASDYTLAAPSPAAGPVGMASAPFTLALAHGSVPVDQFTNLPGTLVVTLSESTGGTFSASPATLSDASPTASPTYTPGSTGVKSVAAAVTGGVLTSGSVAAGNFVTVAADPPAVAYSASAASQPGFMAILAGGGYLAIQIN